MDFKGCTVRLYTSKNDEGRVFPFTAELDAILKNQRQKTDKLKHQGTITPYVFHHNGGKPIAEFRRS